MSADDRNEQDPWELYFEKLLEIVRRSRWNHRSVKGTAEDAVVSAIKSALAREECPPMDDPAIYDFVKQHLLRKIDTYRNGDGQTLRESALSGADGSFVLQLLLTSEDAADDDLPLFDPDREYTPERIHECYAWMLEQAEQLETQRQRDVFRLWADGAQIAEMRAELGLSEHEVKTARREIKRQFQEWGRT